MRNLPAASFDIDDLEGIHEYLMAADVVQVSDELRLIIEEYWPELTHKLQPPRERMH
jgi:hypothetical protein